MPSEYLLKISKERGIPVEALEGKWEKARHTVGGDETDKDYWEKVTAVFNKMIHEERLNKNGILSFNEFLKQET